MNSSTLAEYDNIHITYTLHTFAESKRKAKEFFEPEKRSYYASAQFCCTPEAPNVALDVRLLIIL